MNQVDDYLLDEFKDRELEILSLMAEGLSNAAIGEKLFITKETVRWYNKQIYSKIGTSRRTEAIAKAQRLGLIGGTKTAVSPQIRTHNLPTIATPFLGRAREIQRITTLLEQPNTRLLTILGPGGMGKTRLSIETGHLLLEKFPDGIYLFELAPLNHANNIITVALQALGLQAKGTDDQKEKLLDFCRDKKLLLIFDNFEHILDGAELVDDLMKAAPDCRILATSRERLNLYGETILDLKGLQENGLQLFEAIAKTLKPSFALTAQETVYAQQIVNLVGGMPLGIVLATSWIDSLSVEEIAEEISQDLDMLSTEMRNIPQRQRSMRTVISASWQKLLGSERDACMKLAIFQGGFGRKAAKAVAGASIRILQSLQHKSLIQQVANRRYDLHPLVKQFAQEKLLESDLLSETQTAHLLFFEEYVTDALIAIGHGDYLYPLRDVALERENVLSALDWGLAQQSEVRETAVKLTTSMTQYWYHRSYFKEGVHYCKLALLNLPPDALWVKLMHQCSHFLSELGKIEEATTYAYKLFDFAQNQEDVTYKLTSYSLLTSHLHNLGQFEECVELANQYWALSQSVNHPHHMSVSLSRLGLGYAELGAAEKALEIQQQEVSLLRQQENDMLLSSATYNLGLSLYKKNLIGEAQSLIEESLSLKRLIGDRAGITRRLSLLGVIAIVKHSFEEAKAHLEEADQIAKELNAPRRQFWIFLGWSFYYEMQADWAQSIQYTKDSLELAIQTHYTNYIIGNALILSRLYVKARLPHQAKSYLIQGATQLLDQNWHELYLPCLLAFSRYWLTVGNIPQSIESFLNATHLNQEPRLTHEIDALESELRAQVSAHQFEVMSGELVEQKTIDLIGQYLELLNNE